MGEVDDAVEEFDVVLNDEEQYSIWSAGRSLPPGWRTEGFHGTREQCLDHIETVWTDMRPRSLREAMAAADDVAVEAR